MSKTYWFCELSLPMPKGRGFSLDLVADFYILPAARRQGNGTALLQAVYRHFDEIGVECIELSVRRDNPRGLAFWEAQGFRIGSYRMRQYRNPKTDHAFIGALSSDFA